MVKLRKDGLVPLNTWKKQAKKESPTMRVKYGKRTTRGDNFLDTVSKFKKILNSETKSKKKDQVSLKAQLLQMGTDEEKRTIRQL